MLQDPGSNGLLSLLLPHALPRRSTWMNYFDFQKTLGSPAESQRSVESEEASGVVSLIPLTLLT